mmetsp:Transcript_12463/g.16166  ORF Transcript_12463/g.16166 Transcript_12463/m.16166 type:complete len:290 (+) Transcript_12463:88-957(+)
MPVLKKEQIQTKEVLAWEGVHLLFAHFSLCSRKVMIALELKSISYVRHPVNISKLENRSKFYLGINPRGLVPVLVHNGTVITESNDILEYLESNFPGMPLLPEKSEEAMKVKRLLDMQDSLHMDIRNLTFRFIFPWPMLVPMAKSTLQRMDEEDRANIKDFDGKGQGRIEQRKYYESVVENGGITNTQIKESVDALRTLLRPINEQYEGKVYLLDNKAPSLADVAIFCDIERLLQCGFPVTEEFPHLNKLYSHLVQQVHPVGMPWILKIILPMMQFYRSLTKQTVKHLS